MDRVVTSKTACTVDFNHESADHARQWAEAYSDMRSRCPMAWTESHGGFWVATKYSDVVALAQNNATFTSGKTFDPETGEVTGGLVIPPVPGPAALPDESDMPEWQGYRQLLNRHLAPKAAEARRLSAQRFATGLIDRVIETGRIDFVNDLTSPLPAIVTMEFVGFPLEEAEPFADILHRMIYTPKTDPAFPKVMKEVGGVFQRIDEIIEDNRRQPADNLVSRLIEGQIDGKPVDNDTVRQLIWNILLGGVDTTTALTANTLLYLFQNPGDRRKLIDHPEMLPIAREEFVRFFSPIHATARTAATQSVVNGQTISEGERVLLAYASANRDPDIFDNPEELRLDRFPNRHIGFGAGMHRCVGSFLARVMFETMLGEVLSRMPDYEVDVEASRRYTSISAVNGWITMPATFTPAARVNAA